VTYVETAPDVIAEPDRPDVGRSQFARWGLTKHDVLVLVAGAVFCAGAGPFAFGGWTPRMAALLAGLPLGVVLLVRMAWQRDKAAMAATAFLVWAFVSALASGAPWRSLIGQVDGNTQSLLMFAGTFGFWALARSLSTRGRALVGPVLVVALGVSALVGVMQVLFDIRVGPLAASDGRAGGLEGNAVLFGTTLCAAVAWCACLAVSAVERRAWRVGLAGVAFFALAIGLSGSRVSVISILAVSAAVCWWSKKLRSLCVALAAFGGLVASFVVQHLVQLDNTTVDRFSESGSAARPGLWRAAVSAIGEHPVLGWGPGRIRPAIQHHFSADFVRQYQTDDFASAWNDVHNIVLQMLIGVGIVGVVLLTVFVVYSMRRGNFALSLGAVAISINWLLQPSSVSSLGIAAIFLGASASATVRSRDAVALWPRILTATSIVFGLFAALFLVVADLNLRHAANSGDQAAERAAAAWYGNDPFVIDIFVLGSYHTHGQDLPERLAAARRMVKAEPDIPVWWNELAMTQWDIGDFAGMKASVERALALQPNHIRSWVQMTAYAKHVGDKELEDVARTHACDLGAPVCQAG
jgi:O-antigen ligase